jgi:pimeloyl-ACP methyl ester carboxylesterase
VVWAHGTSGFFPPQAPSAHRSLWYDHSAPFALALAGYAVFAPDYAGLGASRSWDGTPIPHQYSVSPAAAHDSLYGLRAAQRAFPDRLSGADFVAMGHSQGGGVAWALAEALAREADEFADLVAGYKGSVAASPTTRVFGSPKAIMGFLRAAVGLGLDSVFPTFRLEDWLSPLGTARVELAREIGGGIGVIQQLLLTRNDTLAENDDRTWYADAFSRLCEAGRRDFAGPLLVLQGADDAFVPYAVTAETVEETARSYPGRDLEFLVVAGVGHVPVLDATRHIWLGWIADRLDGRPVERKGSVRTDVGSFLPVEQYLRVRNNVPLWAGLPEYSYQVVLGV